MSILQLVVIDILVSLAEWNFISQRIAVMTDRRPELKKDVPTTNTAATDIATIFIEQ